MGQKKQNSNLPTYSELIIPTMKALFALGGSGTVEEINTKVYEIANLSDDILLISHGVDGTTKEVDYRLAWSRTYLKKSGLLENSSRGIWAISKSDIDVVKLDPNEIVRTVRDLNRPVGQTKKPTQILTTELENEVTYEVDNTDK